MNYKKAWDTLKAESGYRETKGISGLTDTVKGLMTRMERRCKEETQKTENKTEKK